MSYLANRQTDKQTKSDKNITSLAEVIIVPLKQSPAAHRIHLPAGRRISTHSAQRRAAHRTGCGPTVQISSQKTNGHQIRRIQTQWTITCGVQCWRLTASLKQSRKHYCRTQGIASGYLEQPTTRTDRQDGEKLLKLSD